MEDETRSPKRRRLDDPYDLSHGDSSPDELGTNSDFETQPSRKHDWTSRHRDSLPSRPRGYDDSPVQDPSESADELGDHVHTFWRQRRSRSQSQPRQNMSEESPEQSGEGTPIETSRRSPIQRPPAPPPPPKPTRLNYKQKFVLKGHKRGVAAVKFSPDGSMIASCSADATIKVWDTSTGKHLRTLEGHLAGISTFAWSPDSATIASGSDDKSIRLWDVPTGKCFPHPLLGHHSYISTLSISPNGNMLASGSYDEAIFLWDIRGGRIMRTLPAHSDPIGGIDFVRDGTLIASCAGDGLIRIWDTATGQCLRTLVHEDNPPVTGVRFAPNGRWVLAWSLDGCVRLWDYVGGRCVKTYQGHVNKRFCVEGGFGVYGARKVAESDPKGLLDGGSKVSANTRELYTTTRREAFVVSGSEDGAIVAWDVTSKKILQRLEGHKDVVLGVDTIQLNGKGFMVSAGFDRTVRVWQEEEDDEENIDAAAAHVEGVGLGEVYGGHVDGDVVRPPTAEDDDAELLGEAEPSP